MQPLELLLAIVVFGLLIVMLHQGMDFATRVTAMQGKLSEAAADFPVVDGALRRLISNAGPGI